MWYTLGEDDEPRGQKSEKEGQMPARVLSSVCVWGGGGGGDMGKGFHSKNFPTSANYYREGPTRVSKMV